VTFDDTDDDDDVVYEDDVYDDDAGSTDTQMVNSKMMKARATTKRQTDDDDDDDDVLLTPVMQIEHQFMIGRKCYFGLRVQSVCRNVLFRMKFKIGGSCVQYVQYVQKTIPFRTVMSDTVHTSATGMEVRAGTSI
jgi:hypothetical protein